MAELIKLSKGQPIYLEVDETNTAAIALYTQLGFGNQETIRAKNGHSYVRMCYGCNS